MGILDKELQTYTQRLPDLLSHAGKFVLIHGETVVETYDTYEDAIKAGYEKFQLDPFLVKQIAQVERIAFFSRDFPKACPV